MHELRQRHCPTSTPTHSKKTSGYRVALSSLCCRPYGTRLQMIAVLEISADHRLHASLIDRITARLPEDFAA